MHATLLLALSLCLAAPSECTPNLDFGSGHLTGWKGQGFTLQAEVPKGNRKVFAVSSADTPAGGRTARLERVITVPAGAAFLSCRAQCVGKAARPDGRLDVRLLAGDEIVPKQVGLPEGWCPTSSVLPPRDGKLLEYRWPVPGHAGKTLRLLLIDDDARPDCHLYCSGFRFLTPGDIEAQEFSQLMVKLQKEHKLNPMFRYDTAHFTALSNADEEFSRARLQNCEMLYRRFFEFFRGKGFVLKEPSTRLMVAIFDTEAGFKAYLGPNELRGAQGFYHTVSNRLIIYDYRENKQFQAVRQKADERGKQIAHQLQRDAYRDTIERQAREFATDQNIALIVHEVAHQLSFNCGLFNRDGHAPFWAVEGFACVCEPTENGSWLGLGKPNPDRLRTLANANGQWVPLRKLVTGDGWKTGSQRETLLFYAQSWALFQMLLEERPQALRNYLKLIWTRRTPDHQLTDFQQAFGADLDGLEKRLNEWMRDKVEKHATRRQ